MNSEYGACAENKILNWLVKDKSHIFKKDVVMISFKKDDNCLKLYPFCDRCQLYVSTRMATLISNKYGLSIATHCISNSSGSLAAKSVGGSHRG